MCPEPWVSHSLVQIQCCQLLSEEQNFNLFRSGFTIWYILECIGTEHVFAFDIAIIKITKKTVQKMSKNWIKNTIRCSFNYFDESYLYPFIFLVDKLYTYTVHVVQSTA